MLKMFVVCNRRTTVIHGCILSLVLIFPFVVEAEGKHKLDRSESITLLTEMSSAWEAHVLKIRHVTGVVTIEQSTLMTSFTPPQISKAGEGKSDSPELPNVSGEAEEAPSILKGEFSQNDTAEVHFKTDWEAGSHWCHWRSTIPMTVVDIASNSEVWRGEEPKESISILTGKDFYHRPVGAKLSSTFGSALPEELVRIDLSQNRSNTGGFRGIVFRAEPRQGESFKERSYMFDSTQLLRIGGQLPQKFLRSAASFLENGIDVEVAVVLDNSGRTEKLFLRVPYSSGRSANGQLICESVWTIAADTPSQFFLLESVTLDLGGGRPKNQAVGLTAANHYTTIWEWDMERFHKGYLCPKNWDFSYLSIRWKSVLSIWAVNHIERTWMFAA